MRTYSVPQKTIETQEQETRVGVLHVPENDGPADGVATRVVCHTIPERGKVYYMLNVNTPLTAAEENVRVIKERTAAEVWKRFDEIVEWHSTKKA